MRKLPVTDAEIVGRTTWYQQTVPLLENAWRKKTLRYAHGNGRSQSQTKGRIRRGPNREKLVLRRDHKGYGDAYSSDLRST